MTVTIDANILVRAGTAAEAAANNVLLLAKEEGVELDTGRRKIGPGNWNDLPYSDRYAVMQANQLTLPDQAAVMSLLRSFMGGPKIPLPDRLTGYEITGTIYFVDGVSGSDAANGTTYLTAWKTTAHVAAIIALGNGVLFAGGKQINLTATIAVGAGGTSAANAFVIGGYDPATGRRLRNGNGLKALINGNGLDKAITVGHDFVCVDGVEVFGCGNSGTAAVEVGFSNVQVINSTIRNNAGIGYLYVGTGTGCVLEGSDVHGNAGGDIFNFILNDANDHRVTFCTGGGLYYWDAGTPHKCFGTIAGNAFSGTTTGTAINVECNGGVLKIFSNEVSNCLNGVGLSGTQGSTASDFSGTQVIDHKFRDIGQFAVWGQQATGVVCQWNDMQYVGSFNRGITRGNASNFGRGVELVGTTAARSCSQWLVQFNLASDIYNFEPGGSEGVGFGSDDFTHDCRFLSNFAINCEGNGIQVNGSTSTQVESNIVINPCCVSGRGTVWQGNTQGGIVLSASPLTFCTTNTIVGFQGPNHLFGISENQSFASHGSVHTNNLVIGFTVAAIELNDGAGNTTEVTTIAEDCPAIVVNVAHTAVTPSATSRLVSAGVTGAEAPYYVPKVGGICDGTGTAVRPGLLSFRGQPIGTNTPVGASPAGVI